MLFTDSFNHGGTERQVVETLRLLDRSKYDLLVGCLKNRGAFLDDVHAMNIPIAEFPITSLANRSTVLWMRKLVKFLRDEKIDLVHTFDYYTDIFAVPAARLARVPVVIASRRDPLNTRGALERATLSVACWMAHGIVANSADAAAMASGGAHARSPKVLILGNAVNPSNYRTTPCTPELRNQLGLPVASTLVGVLATLRIGKGHHTFLHAAARVVAGWNQAQRDLRFVLVGGGPERVALQALARELGIAERVLFVGDRSNVADWLAAMDLMVLPSDYDSLPNALLEAMAAARPVVATSVGGVPEVVEDGINALLVPRGDAAAMAAAILRVLADEGLCRRLGAAGRACIERDFTPASAKKKLEAFYDRLLAAHKEGRA
jgi:glycosyltransferase involved in cell wall biosynthesis